MTQNQPAIITPELALANLSKAAETIPCDGPTRDALRECVRILAALIPPPAAPAPHAVLIDPPS